MQTKSIFTSKTFWFGVLQIAFAAVGYFAGWLDSGTAMTLFVTGCGSVGLRFKTSEPVSLVGGIR